MEQRRAVILSVGQCSYDDARLAQWLRRESGAQLRTAATATSALAALREDRFDLVLVNRVLDADGSSGLELIAAILQDSALAAPPVMLVSDRAEAQESAERLGAAPGIGKAGIGSPIANARILAVLGGK